MPLSAGTRLGPYEILAPIGAGGMGEVYRARDTRLNRDVAIKVSAAQFNERFEREARAIAALNHPNICQIYDVGPNYLVMELIGGATLAERIKENPIPLDEALVIGRQITDALEAAHEKGIVHRDLKPANIKITPDGTVKVLDFGLAAMSATSAAPPSAGELHSPTLSPTFTMTQAGMILGTAAYMSPEQARGKQVDKRADIWAFGAVFYEMLTGQRPFTGEDLGDTLAAVIRDPPKLDAAPVSVQRLLRRCLEKDPKKRLRDIGDVWELLDGEPLGVPERRPGGRSYLGWMIGMALSTLIAAALAFLHFRETPPEVHVVNTTLLAPEGAEFDFASTLALPAISPDGTRVVFGARRKDGKTQLYLRNLDSPNAQALPGTEGAALPFWAPDSRSLGFGQGNKLKKIDIQGGPPSGIIDLSGPLRGASWSPLGVIAFAVTSGPTPIFRVAAVGGKASPTTAAESGTESLGDRYPSFLPDGRHFLYTTARTGDFAVRVGSLDEAGKPGKLIAQASSNALYSHGHLLFLRENNLMAQPFDVDRLETNGEAMPLAEEVPIFYGNSRPAVFSVSAGGLLVYQSGAVVSTQSRLVWKDRRGTVLRNLGEPTGRIGSIALSPDGRRVAADVFNRSGLENSDLWIYDVARSIATRFTFDPAGDRSPVWSPDGNMLYFASNRRSFNDLFRKASNGTGADELVLNDSVNKNPSSLSPDGKLLLFARTGEKTGTDLWVFPVPAMPAQGKQETWKFLQTPFNEGRGQFSPTGQWVAYQSDESGKNEVYAASFPDHRSKRQISSGGGTSPRWRHDGKELFYVTLDGQLMAAQITANKGTLEVGSIEKLFDGLVISRGVTYDVSADGQKFVVVDDGASTTRPLTLLQNWTALRR